MEDYNRVQPLILVLLMLIVHVFGGCNSIEVPTVVEEVTCEPGFGGVTCERCEPGNYCSGQTDPIPCETGSWDDDQDPATECLPWSDCRAGEYRMSEGTTTEDVVCPPCPAHTYNRHINATSCLAWTRCPRGTRAYDGTTTTDQKCEPCPEGTFGQWVDSPECVEWTTCYAGSYVFIEPSSENDRRCEFCALGTYNQHKNLPQCEPWEDCQPGQYMVVAGYHQSSPVCEPCPEGMYTDGINQAECRELGECQPGSYLKVPQTQTAALVCEQCLIGTFCPGGDTPLERCPDGTWDHDADTTTPCVPWKDCPSDYLAVEGSNTKDRVCWPCPPRHFAPANSPTCFPRPDCLAGTYLSDVDSLCRSCAPNTYSTGINMPACEPKTECIAGSYVGNDGGATSNRVCLPCLLGTYSDVTNANGCVELPDCPVGSFVTGRSTNSAGACTPCPPGTDSMFPNSEICTPPDVCAPGTRIVDGECVVCEIGRYCAGESNPSWPCWGGVSWDHDANPATLCQTKTTCQPGSFVAHEGNALNDRQCAPCPDGQFSDTTNATSCTQWQNCPHDSYVLADGNSLQDRVCAPCPYGMLSAGPNALACERSGFRGIHVGSEGRCAIRNHDSTPICWGHIQAPNVSYPINAIVTNRSRVAMLNTLGEVICPDSNCSMLPGPGYTDMTFVNGVCARKSNGFVSCQNINNLPAVSFDSFSASYYGICGIRSSDRRFKCWNGNWSGTSIPEQVALQVQADPLCILRPDNKIICEYSNPPNFDFLEFDQECGIRTNGQVACWSMYSPLAIQGYATELSMYDSGSVCVVRPDSTITCHGGTEIEQTAPNDRRYLTAHRTCAMRASNQKIDCIFEFNGLGLNDWNDVPILNNEPLLDFRLGKNLRCGIRSSDQKIFCEGYPWNHSTSGGWSSPDAYKAIEMGTNVVCGIRANDGQVGCWGAAPPEMFLTPQGVSFDSISVGTFGCGIRTSDKGIECWGTAHTPPSGTYRAVTVGTDFACAIEPNKSVSCFGNVPQATQGIVGSQAVEISAFEDRICAIRAADHEGQCWGFSALIQGLPNEKLYVITTVKTGYCGIRNDGKYICRGEHIANPF